MNQERTGRRVFFLVEIRNIKISETILLDFKTINIAKLIITLIIETSNQKKDNLINKQRKRETNNIS